MGFGDPFPGENVTDLADPDDLGAFVAQCVQNASRRFHRVIVPARGAAKVSGVALEGPRNPPANPRGVRVFPSHFANFVERPDGDDVFMRRNLQNRVGRSVENRPAAPEMLRAELLQHNCATTRVVADELNPGLGLDLLDEVGREALKNGKWFFQDNPSDLPVTSRRVFPSGTLLHSSVACSGPTRAAPSQNMFQA